MNKSHTMHAHKALLFTNECSFNILILKNITNMFGYHYPIEIIHYINVLYLKLFPINLLDQFYPQISCSDSHTMCVTKDSECYAWGNNDWGQLGIGDIYNSSFPQRVFLDNVLTIYCRDEYTMAITKNAQSYAWGNNELGQLGLGDNISRNMPEKINLDDVISISCGTDYSVAITKNNQSYAWGKNDYFQLGLGDSHTHNSPQRIGLDNILSISCGVYHTMAVTEDHKCYSWGRNDDGQLGLGDIFDRALPEKIPLDNIISVSCGEFHSMVLTANGECYVWGSNMSGQLGLGHDDNRHNGNRHDDNRHNGNRHNGNRPDDNRHNGNRPDDHRRNFPCKLNLDNVVSIMCVDRSSMAMTKDSRGRYQCWAWGSNDHGQLGLSDNHDHTSPKKIDLDNILSLDYNLCTVAITKDRELYTWGKNYNGQLGLGDPSHGATYTYPWLRCRQSGQLDRYTPNKNILDNIVNVSRGSRHMVAATADMRYYTWGLNNHGQLGLGDYDSRNLPTEIIFKF